jgi:hypothetical protein
MSSDAMEKRSFRCPASLWKAVQAKTTKQNTDVSAVIRAKLVEYVTNDEDTTAAPPWR